MIRVEDYHKTYRETVAVDGLSFEVAAGSIMGLAGPNGAGKTTTMRARAGIIRPTSGWLSIAGHDVVHDSIAAKRALAYIPDELKLFDALTVWEHLEFTLMAVRTSRYARIISLVIGITIGIIAFMAPRNPAGPDFVSFMGLGFMVYLTFIFSMQLPWAFRGDIMHMDCLKSPPIAPLAVALGELTDGVILLAMIQLVLLIGLLGAGGNPMLILTITTFLIPFDLLILAMSNTLFLIYPVRNAQGTSADFQMVGRMMLFMLLLFLMLIPALGIPLGFAGLTYVLSGYHFPAFAVTSWVLLAAEVPLWLFLLASMFMRFDPGTEIPP